MTVDKAEEGLKATRRAIRRGQSLYFRIEDARDLVRECERNDLAVVGAEGFSIGENGILPHLDMIADCLAWANDWYGFDWGGFRNDCNRFMLDFLEEGSGKRIDGTLVFNFVVMEPGEYDDFSRTHEEARLEHGLVPLDKPRVKRRHEHRARI